MNLTITKTEFKKCIFLILFFLNLETCLSSNETNLVELSVIHMNDFHARYEATSLDSSICQNEKCIGGFSRLYATITNLLKTKPNSILLNAGDNFKGTLWYQIFRWNVTQYFFNKLPFDAATLGNNEFVDGIEGLVPYLQHLKFSVVVSNIDASQEPSLNGLFKKSVVIERNGLKIGIIGVLLSSSIQSRNGIGKLIFLDESRSVNAEAERLVREEGVFTNVVLSHCGYNVDQEIAKNATSKISLIVGGHTHSFLYTGEPVPGSDIPIGPYPTIVENNFGKKVLVVQASSFTKYLGNITVFYNEDGDAVSWSGAPIFLDSELAQDKIINEELEPWKKTIDQYEGEVIGKTVVRLDQTRCSMAECLLGNLITDAMVLWYANSSESETWSDTSIAVTNVDVLKCDIDKGDITLNDILQCVILFINTIDLAEIEGKHLKEILESSTTNTTVTLLQVSGMKIKYDLRMPKGSRVTSILIRCRRCDVPVYEPLDPNKTYHITLPSLLARGVFGFTLFTKYLKNRQIGYLDVDVFVDHIRRTSPIFQEIEGRIKIIK